MNHSFEHLRNFRDFSDYQCSDGTTLRGNVFARSDNPREISKKEIEELRKRGFTTVIDLRRENERVLLPDRLSMADGFDYHPIVMNDITYYELGEVIKPEDIASAYYRMLDISRERIASIFRLLASSESGVLFHCESGKDRTGTIAALLLLLCDVEDATISEDYRLSYDCMYFEASDLISDPALVPMAETMDLFLRYFHRDYPVAEDFFYNIGLTKNEVDMIRRKIKI